MSRWAWEDSDLEGWAARSRVPTCWKLAGSVGLESGDAREVAEMATSGGVRTWNLMGAMQGFERGRELSDSCFKKVAAEGQREMKRPLGP